MDRKGQLRNVAFGGAWSEQIAGDEELSQAIDYLRVSAERSQEEDLSQDAALDDALRVAARAHPKGADLAARYRKALRIPLVAERVRELVRVADLFDNAVAGRLNSRL